MHIAEHPAERRFLERGDGPVAEWYEARLKLRRDLLEWPGESPIAFADALGALAPDVLAVHLATVRLFLHVLAATVWVGGQLTLAGLVPGLRAISPDAPRIFDRVRLDR